MAMGSNHETKVALNEVLQRRECCICEGTGGRKTLKKPLDDRGTKTTWTAMQWHLNSPGKRAIKELDEEKFAKQRLRERRMRRTYIQVAANGPLQKWGTCDCFSRSTMRIICQATCYVVLWPYGHGMAMVSGGHGAACAMRSARARHALHARHARPCWV